MSPQSHESSPPARAAWRGPLGLLGLLLLSSLAGCLGDVPGFDPLSRSGSLTNGENGVIHIATGMHVEVLAPLFDRYEDETGVKVIAVYEGGLDGSLDRIVIDRIHQQERSDLLLARSAVGLEARLVDARGALFNYESPEADDRTRNRSDPDGFWTTWAEAGHVIGWQNTSPQCDHLLEGDVPSRVRAFAQVPFVDTLAGEVGMAGLTKQWDSNGAMAARWIHQWDGGEQAVDADNATAFANSLAAVMHDNMPAHSEPDVGLALGSGKICVAILGSDTVVRAQQAYSAGRTFEAMHPIRLTHPDQEAGGWGEVVDQLTASVVAGGNDQAAHAFIDWLLRPATQDFLGPAIGLTPVRAGADSGPAPSPSDFRESPVDVQTLARLMPLVGPTFDPLREAHAIEG